MDAQVLSLLQKIKEKLEQHGDQVATAESCTGGILATWLTYLPGSSKTYLGGVNAYANQVKIDLLNVDPLLIQDHGAVSSAVAKAMATGVKAAFGATYGISITGIAGPDGGTAAKPVGTVYCGFAAPGGVTSVMWQLDGDRNTIRQKAALRALEILYGNL